MARPVGLEDRAPQLLELLRRLLEVGEVGRGEGLGVLVDPLDVLVARDRPEARAAVVLVVPVHGRLAPQRVEHAPGLAALEDVEIRQVHLVQRNRGRCHLHSSGRVGPTIRLDPNVIQSDTSVKGSARGGAPRARPTILYVVPDHQSGLA